MNPKRSLNAPDYPPRIGKNLNSEFRGNFIGPKCQLTLAARFDQHFRFRRHQELPGRAGASVAARLGAPASDRACRDRISGRRARVGP